MTNAAAKLAKLINAATPAAIAKKQAALESAKAELAILEANCENERAIFARALVLKRAGALGRMMSAAKLRA
jgi:prephenate dehydratase